MFTNEQLFTIQRLLFGDSTVLLTGATRRFSKDKTLTAIRFYRLFRSLEQLCVVFGPFEDVCSTLVTDKNTGFVHDKVKM